MTQPTLDFVKAQAKALRRALQAEGTTISHARSLELVALQYGARDWNTLHARLGKGGAETGLALGAQVSGHYLGQAYTGRIVSLGSRRPSPRRDRAGSTDRHRGVRQLFELASPYSRNCRQGWPQPSQNIGRHTASDGGEIAALTKRSACSNHPGLSARFIQLQRR